MATVATVGLQGVAKVLTQTTATAAVTRPLDNKFRIPVGATYVKGLAVEVGSTGDSNNTYVVGNYSVTVVHHLSDPEDSNTYLSGDALTDQHVLMQKSFWRTISGVHELLDGPELTLPTRVGNVIEYTVRAQVSISP